MARRYKFGDLAWRARCSVVILCLIMNSCSHPIAGKLLDEFDQPIASKDARVNIVSLDQNNEQPVRIVKEVNQNGEFVIDENIPKGTYLIEALVPGFSIESQKIAFNKASKVIIVLKRLSKIEQNNAIHSHLNIPAGRGEGKASLTPPNL